MREVEEILKELNEAHVMDAASHGTSTWPGMTFEQGVAAALLWALGETDTNPLGDGR